MKIDENKYYIVRTRGAGIFFGKIISQVGKEVTMTDARRLWRWRGASECCQLAAEGVKDPDACKFTMYVDEVTLLEAVEIQPCTQESELCIKEVKIWKI